MPTILAPPPTQLWPHQTLYYKTAQKRATDLFDVIDEDLHPQVLLLALPTTPDQVTLCLEPAVCHLDLPAFDDAIARGHDLQQQMPWPYIERDDIPPIRSTAAV